MFSTKPMENDTLIDSIEKFRTEGLADNIHHGTRDFGFGAGVMIGEVCNYLGTNVGCHYHDYIAEVYFSTVGIGEVAFVKELKE